MDTNVVLPPRRTQRPFFILSVARNNRKMKKLVFDQVLVMILLLKIGEISCKCEVKSPIDRRPF